MYFFLCQPLMSHFVWLLFGLHGADDPLHYAEGKLLLQFLPVTGEPYT